VLVGLHSVSIFNVKVRDVDPSAPSTKPSSKISSWSLIAVTPVKFSEIVEKSLVSIALADSVVLLVRGPSTVSSINFRTLSTAPSRCHSRASELILSKLYVAEVLACTASYALKVGFS
jgi:hypothetical protein